MKVVLLRMEGNKYGAWVVDTNDNKLMFLGYHFLHTGDTVEGVLKTLTAELKIVIGNACG